MHYIHIPPLGIIKNMFPHISKFGDYCFTAQRGESVLQMIAEFSFVELRELLCREVIPERVLCPVEQLQASSSKESREMLHVSKEYAQNPCL